MHTDGGDLAVLDPDAGRAGQTAGRQTELSQGVDEDLLEAAHIGDDVPPPVPQIENRVAHHLPRTVIGDVAAAVGFEKLDTGALEHLRARQQVLAPPVAAHGDHVRVLEQEQLVGDRAKLAASDQLGLQVERLTVAETPQNPQLAPTH